MLFGTYVYYLFLNGGTMMQKERLDKIFEFTLAVNKAKQIRCAGWVRNKIKNAEHVGDHCFSTAIFSYIMADYLKLDKNKCMLMALTHDLNEIIGGDIPHRPTEKLQGISDLDMKALENRNAAKVLSMLPKKIESDLLGIYKEYDACMTAEAKLVSQVSALDYIFLLMDYFKQFKDKRNIDDFFVTAERRIHTQELKYMYQKAEKAIRK